MGSALNGIHTIEQLELDDRRCLEIAALVWIAGDSFWIKHACQIVLVD